MHRPVLAVAGTVAALALVLNYKTAPNRPGHLAAVGAPAQTTPAAAGSPPDTASAPAGRAGTAPGAAGAGAPGAAGSGAPGTAGAATTRPGATPATATPTPATPTTATPTTAAATTTRVVTGPVADTPYGPVQVQVTVTAGRLTNVVALQLPSDRSRSRSISQRAAPVLRSEALAAQSAQIDIVSGASYTSDGYARSLQAALDQARR